MKEFFLDLHSDLCIDHNDKTKHSDFCAYNPKRFLFFVGTRFFLITYYGCVGQGDYDFKVDIIKQAIGKYKIFNRYEVNKSVNVEQDLKDFRIRNQELKKHIYQINYLYSNNAGKQFAIATKTEYLDSICNQDEVDENYQAAKKFLEEKKYTWMIEPLKNLYYSNYLHGQSSAECYKTIEHLVTSINKMTK